MTINNGRAAFAISALGALAFAALTTVAHAQFVTVDLDDQGEDACGVGMVSGLNPNGDNFLTVRAGPGTEYDSMNQLGPDTMVSMCSESGGWIGIVYGGDGCVGGSPVGDTQNGPYSGPCQWGWVSGKYVQSIAG